MRLIVAAWTIAVAVFSSSGARPVAQQRPVATPDYCILSVEEERGLLAILRRDGTRVASVPIGGRPHEIEVSSDGATAYVTQFGIADYDHRIGTPGTKVVEAALQSARVTGVFALPAGSRGPHGVKLRPHSRELFVNTEVDGDRMFVFDAKTRRLRRSFGLPPGTHNFIFAPDGRTLFSFAGKGGLSKVDATSGEIAATIDGGSPIRGLAFTRAGELLASARGELLVIDALSFKLKRRMLAPVHGQLLYPTQLASGDFAVPAMDDNGIVIFTPGSARFIPTGKAPIIVRQASDGLIYVANVDDTYLSTLTALGVPLAHINGVLTPNGLAFAPCPAQ